MANPPFNVDKVKSETAQNAGRLPFGLPGVNKNKEIGNANYLWISYFYAYLNETGRAGFVMAASATDSQGKDKTIREQLINTGDVDVMLSVGNNFFYTKSLPCTLWFFDKAKREENKDKVLFIDARNYYTVVDRTLNEWSEWQMKNLNAIVWLYRGEKEKYKKLLNEYLAEIINSVTIVIEQAEDLAQNLPDSYNYVIYSACNNAKTALSALSIKNLNELNNVMTELRCSTDKSEGNTIKDASESDRDIGQKLAADFGFKTYREYEKSIEIKAGLSAQYAEDVKIIIKEVQWLTDKFGDGEYKDTLGLCKCATRAEIAEKGYSLTPGAYVGVPPVEEDSVDFAVRMAEIHSELLTLQAESNKLMDTISNNMKEMGL